MSLAPQLEAQFKGYVGGFGLDIDLTVPASGLTVIWGPSGSGKTTLLRCIAGLTRLNGQVSFNGEVWQDKARFVPVHQRRIGFVFQESSLFAHLSVEGNLAFAQNRARHEPLIKREDLIDLMGISPLLNRPVVALSGGERQRVSIARAVLSAPRLLCMDEPLANLDVDRRHEVLRFIEALHGSLDVPILYVTHDPQEAERLADRRIVLSHGRVEAVIEGRIDRSLAGLRERLRLIGPDRLRDELVVLGTPPAAADLAVSGLSQT
jgi:molybdate transport system ATP-binding protein